MSRLPQGRLTLTSGVAIPVADVASAPTVYFTPYGGNALDYSTWGTFAELSASVPAGSTGQLFDAYLVGGTTLAFGPAWSTVQTRGAGADVELYQGLYVNKAAMTIGGASVAARAALCVGTIRLTGSGLTTDSPTKRFVSNMYNLAPRKLRRGLGNTSWTYNSTTPHAAAASPNALVEFVSAMPRKVDCGVLILAQAAYATPTRAYVGIGVDTQNPPSLDTLFAFNTTTAPVIMPVNANYDGVPGLGYRSLIWQEWTDNLVTFYSGDNNGMSGEIWN